MTGIVVDNKSVGARYARTTETINPETEVYVRDLLPGESVWSYIPKDLPVEEDEEEDLGEDLGEDFGEEEPYEKGQD